MSASSSTPGEPPQGGSNDPVDHSITFKALDFIFAGATNGFVEFRFFAAGRNTKGAGSSTPEG
jgi:hypothetical protein